MTMPHLSNCGHSEDGWCLDCVGELWERGQALEAHIREAADDAFKNAVRATENGDLYLREYFSKLNDWHLAALQPKAGK